MPFIKIEIKPSPDELAAPFYKNYGKFLDRKIEALTRRVYRNIREEAPIKTGELRRSIKFKKRGLANYEIMVDQRTRGGKYERFVRLGTRGPYAIFPVKKKALWWPGLPHPIKAVYNHPGIKANPYWERGLDRSRVDIDNVEALIGLEMESELIK